MRRHLREEDLSLTGKVVLTVTAWFVAILLMGPAYVLATIGGMTVAESCGYHRLFGLAAGILAVAGASKLRAWGERE